MPKLTGDYKVHFVELHAGKDDTTACGRTLRGHHGGRLWASGPHSAQTIAVTSDPKDVDCRKCMRELVNGKT